MRVKAQYPNADTFATTLREVVNANQHNWGAILRMGNEWHVAEPRPILLAQLFWNAALWPLALWGFAASRERMVSYGG